MKFKLLAVCALVLVAGCSGGDKASNNGSAAAAKPAATAPAAEAKKVPLTTDRLAYSRLPDQKIKLNLPFTFKSDKAVAADDGKVRGTMVLDYRDTATEQVWPTLDASFKKAGYASSELKADSKNQERRQYKKKGARTLTVTLVPAANAKAEGSLLLSWQVAQLAMPAAVAAAP